MALHTVLWIDHSQARLFDLDTETVNGLGNRKKIGRAHV